MRTENKDLMTQARESLEGKWGLAIGTFLMYILATGLLQFIPKIGSIVSLIIAGPFAVGISIFSLALSRDNNPTYEQVFDGFKNFQTFFAHRHHQLPVRIDFQNAAESRGGLL